MNPQLTLNQATINLERNNYQRAIEQAVQVLNHQPGSAHALYIYAIANAHLNNKKTALDTFQKLIEQMPNNSDIHYNHGMIQNMFGNSTAALKAFKKTISLNPKHTFAHINLGNILNQNGQIDLAFESYLMALKINPENPGLLDNLSQTYFKNKQFIRSLEHISKLKLIQQLTEHQLSLEIQCYVQLGNYRTADKHAMALIESHPDSILGHYFHGICSQKLARYPVAIIAYTNGLKLDSNHNDCLKNLAICYNYSAQYNASKTIIEQLYTKNINNLDTLLFDFTLKEMNNELRLDDETFLHAIKANPQHPELYILHGKALIAGKMYKQAIKLLSKPPISMTKPVKTEGLFLLADAYDKSSQYDLAWITYSEANTLIHEDFTDTFNDKLTRLIPQLNDLPRQDKPGYSASPTSAKIVFVIGFPRSGTTLIDSILSSQNDAIVLEETPLIADLAEQVLGNHKFDQYIDILLNLEAADIEALRDEYFKRVALYHQWDNQQTIIDKSPLNMIHTLLIHKLFPESPIIFAMRHPLDVCISCFMQNFRANPELTAAFSSTESITTTYQNLMTVWQLINSKIKLKKLIVRYEDLISHTEQQTRDLVEFAGLDWSDEYLKFYTTVKDRGMIHNPSYNQVNQDIYSSKMFRYKNYENYLTQLRTAVAPWIKTYNY